MTVTPIQLTPDWPMLVVTYCSTARLEPSDAHADAHWLDSEPGFSFDLVIQAPQARIKAALYHGRYDPNQEMDDWGFPGPTFECGNVAHTPELMLLQECDATSLELARRIGLAVQHDTITLPYHDDMLVVPRFKDEQPAYFGDFSLDREELRSTH